MKRKGLRLPLMRRPDPVLDREELEFLEERCTSYINTAEQAMAQSRVSETLIVGNQVANRCREKLREVLATMR